GTDLTVTSGQRIGTGSVPDNLVALADDSLFVEGTAEIDGGLYVDGAVDFDSSLDVAGTATVSDLSCVDCLDFTELSDTLALDTSTSITQDGAEVLTITNSGTGNTIVNLSSTGDFIIQDNGVAAFTVNDSGNGTFAGTLGVTGAVTLTDDLAVNGDDVTSDGNLSLSATGYTRVGDTGVPGDATTDDSLYVEGAFEVDGTAYFDSALTIDANNIDGTNFDVTGSTGAVSAAAGAFDIDSSGNITDGGNVLIDPSSRVDANAAGVLSFGTTTATSLAFGSASVTAITITTDANASNDVSITGGVSTTRDVTVGTDLTVTSGQRIGTGSVPDNLVALADDSLFVEGTAEIDGGLYVDGAVDFDSSLDVAGTATVSDLSCVDCLDFTELEDILNLDVATEIDNGLADGNLFSINLSSTGDFTIEDSGTAFVTFNDDRSIDYSSNQTTTDPFDFTADSVSSANALDFSVDGLTTGRGIYLTTTSGVATSGDLFVASETGQYTTNGVSVSGNVLDISRSLDVNDGIGGAIAVSVVSPVVAISDNCTSTGDDTCTHTGNVLSLTQNYTSSTGNTLAISSAGSGDAINIAGSGTGNAIDIDATTYGIDIELQNAETISNDTNGQIIFGISSANELSLNSTELFPSSDSGLDLGSSTSQFADLFLDGGNINLDNATDIDIDDNTVSAFTITEGSTNYLDITTSNTLETITLGSASLTRLTITTANSGATDVSLTGSLAISNDLAVVDDVNFQGDANFTLDDGDSMDLIGDGSSTSTLLSIVQTTLTADVDAQYISLTQNDGTAAGADNVGVNINLTGNDTDGDMFGIRIIGNSTANATSGTYEAGISIQNSEASSNSMPDAIIVNATGGSGVITDALDAAESNITNAVNAGTNFYTMDGIRSFEGVTGTLTFEDTSGNDLMRLVDASDTGVMTLTGALIAQAGSPFTDYSAVAASGVVIGQQTNSTALSANRNDMGGYFSVTSDANPGAFTHTLYGAEGIVTYTRSSGSAANAIYGVSGVANHSSSALTMGTSAGILGRTGSNTAGGTITNAIGVDGYITAGDGAITNGYGGNFSNTADGTSRFGIYAEASGGTNNFAGYFASAPVHIAVDSSPTTPDFATGAGDLYVESDLEIDSDLRVDGGDLTSSSSTFNFFDSSSNSTTLDIGGVTTDLANVISIATNGTSADTISIGNTNASTTLALNGGDDWNMSTGGVLTILPAATGTFLDFDLETEWTTGDLINADFDSATTQTGRINVLDIDLSGLTPDGVNFLYGIHVDDPASAQAANQYGVYIEGTNWDYGLVSADLVSVGLGATSSTTAVCSSLAGATPPSAGTAYELRDCDGGPSADYAEQYPVASGISYGDIVVPGNSAVVTEDGQTIVQLVKSSTPYQGPVAGIVSNNYGDFTSAGYNVNDSDNPMPVALVGRVPVNVTNENGSIQVGDYLTTSSTQGFAMKATEVGRVIGMALSDFSGPTGQVMVQVNNGWYLGNVIGSDGSSTVVTDKAVMAPLGTASVSQPSFDSYGFALRGSAWDGNEAQAVEMMLKASVTDQDNYRLSVRNTTDTEVAYITDKGTMQIAGDMVISGRLYPSDRGVAQTEKYIYYDGSEGAGGDYMRTNAKGWSTGSYDFAEMFPSSEILSPGEVVVFSGEGEKVRRSVEVDESGLVGIVSTRPGFLAGENSAGSYPIALSGRVPTFVTTENGEIKIGDPLTASSKSGYAMKATKSGIVVGYALESLSSGEGSILSYVNVGYWNGGKTSSTPGVNNQASGFAMNTNTNFSSLEMTGNIFMAGHEIMSIGRLAGISDVWEISQDGTIKTEALLKTVIRSYTDEKVETIAVTSPEAVITLSGTSKLSGGTSEVRFESVSQEFNDVIAADAPIRVFVTPNSPVSLYVSEKDNNHFVVKQFGGEVVDAEFDWMVTAYRKGYEPKEQVSDVGDQISEVLSPELVEWVIGEMDIPMVDGLQVESVDPASPASPDTTIIDPAVEVEGGEQAEEPTETLIETISSAQEDE
ncbi:hypothetical protein HYV69_00560, partial [Candidatus Uhrbacteria bacterium]|nr:hypothetical protein [Candidatus Uhrbacteria bacterium]